MECVTLLCEPRAHIDRDVDPLPTHAVNVGDGLLPRDITEPWRRLDRTRLRCKRTDGLVIAVLRRCAFRSKGDDNIGTLGLQEIDDLADHSFLVRLCKRAVLMTTEARPVHAKD